MTGNPRAGEELSKESCGYLKAWSLAYVGEDEAVCGRASASCEGCVTSHHKAMIKGGMGMHEGDISEVKRTLRVGDRVDIFGQMEGGGKVDRVLCVENQDRCACVEEQHGNARQDIDEKAGGGWGKLQDGMWESCARSAGQSHGEVEKCCRRTSEMVPQSPVMTIGDASKNQRAVVFADFIVQTFGRIRSSLM